MQIETINGLEGYCQELREVIRSGSDDAGKAHERYLESLDTLRQIDHDMWEFEDKEQRREIDREKNEESAEIEKSKQKLTPGRVALDVAKVVVPGLIAGFFAIKMQNTAGQFEETGSWRSDASRMAHNNAPRLPWK